MISACFTPTLIFLNLSGAMDVPTILKNTMGMMGYAKNRNRLA